MRIYTPPRMNYIPDDAKLVFKGVLYDTYQWKQKMFDGSFKTFEMVKRSDTVKVIVVDRNSLLLTRQTQPGRPEFIDFPGGRNDSEDDSEIYAAKRELIEETGYACRNWSLISAVQANTDVDQCYYIFLATDAYAVQAQALDSGEKIEVIRMKFNEWKSLRDDPIVRYYPKEIFDGINSIEELIELPKLYTYETD